MWNNLIVDFVDLWRYCKRCDVYGTDVPCWCCYQTDMQKVVVAPPPSKCAGRGAAASDLTYDEMETS